MIPIKKYPKKYNKKTNTVIGHTDPYIPFHSGFGVTMICADFVFRF